MASAPAMSRCFRSLLTAVGLHIGLSPPGLRAQSSGATSSDSPSSYEERYAELKGLRPSAERVASVQGLVLRRDVGEFRLERGSLYYLSPVGGRVVGAVFVGKGIFSFAPPSSMEQERLALFEKSKKLAVPLTGAVFLFADSTGSELERQLIFQAGRVPGEAQRVLSEALRYLCDESKSSCDPDLMEAFLNGESTDLFYAHIRRDAGDPLMFAVNPRLNEAVQLMARRRGSSIGMETEIVSQFARQGDTLPATTYARKPLLGIRHYEIDTRLEHTTLGDVRFGATARLLLAAEAAAGPWVPLRLFEKLEIDSARWAEGEPVEVIKGKDSSTLWINLGRRLRSGETRSLSLSYRGDLIDRYGDWFFIKSAAAWYPIPLDGRSLATFDLTYRTPTSLVLASVGDRKDSSVVNRTVVTRWVTPNPVTFAAFNVGRFKEHRIQADGIGPITVLASEDAHKAFTRTLLRQGVAGPGPQRNMKEVVGRDVVNSMKFFGHVFGPAPVAHFYATEVPFFHGLAFPGLVHLCWTTFRNTEQNGFDEFFRAHEVAHQWWGLGVDYTTYHEQWLSEGFASFAGLWYLQTVRKNKSYFDMLDRWRTDILDRRNEPAPVWLGWRNSSGLDENGYNIIVYYKGAWTLHMLRMMMLDLKTMSEERFIQTMRDFYRDYQGKRASTADFRRIAEKHVGADLGWFFDQWIYGSAVPSYRVAYQSVPAENGQFRVRLRVRQDNVPDDFQMYVPVTLDLGQNRIARLRIKVQGPRSDIDLPLMRSKPKNVRFNDLHGVLAEVRMEEWKD